MSKAKRPSVEEKVEELAQRVELLQEQTKSMATHIRLLEAALELKRETQRLQKAQRRKIQDFTQAEPQFKVMKQGELEELK